ATTAAAPPAPAPPASSSAGPGVPQAAQVALRYLGIKYTWGGASPGTGFDCSGLVMYVYEQLGIALPHQSQSQWNYGVPVSRSQLLPGDLVFYDALSHVAIYIGNGQVVHAPQTGDVVKISAVDAAGGSYAGARRLSLP
ncbi:MAG: C40 family peptidase, partial [Gaiellaceae bacterium]